MNDYELALNNIIDAIEMLHRHIEDGSFNHPNWSISKIRELVDNSKKYRWHDLRKNPDDLPENFESVLICVKGFEGKAIGVNIAIHSSFTKLWGTESYSYKDCEVIAWRKIDPFEEE